MFASRIFTQGAKGEVFFAIQKMVFCVSRKVCIGESLNVAIKKQKSAKETCVVDICVVFERFGPVRKVDCWP